MPNNNSRFVAHIDILGMKKLMDKDPKKAWQVLSGLSLAREHTHDIEVEFADTGKKATVASEIFSVMFSDTIVFFTKSDSDEELSLIVLAVSELLHKAFLHFVPVRAGIARGQFFFNIEKSMYAGPALIDAYLLGESAKWIGIVVDESIFLAANRIPLLSGKSAFVIKARIPHKQVTVDGYAVNWPAAFAHDLKVNPPVSLELFYSMFSHWFGPFESLGENEQKKYINTVEFMNKMLSEHSLQNV